MPKYMIIGIYDDNGQRYADTVHAKDAAAAERKAPDGLIVAAVLEIQSFEYALEHGGYQPMALVL